MIRSDRTLSLQNSVFREIRIKKRFTINVIQKDRAYT